MAKVYFTASPGICEDAGEGSLSGNHDAGQYIGTTGALSGPEAPQNTGLLDARGAPIYSAETRKPIGFHLRAELSNHTG